MFSGKGGWNTKGGRFLTFGKVDPSAHDIFLHTRTLMILWHFRRSKGDDGHRRPIFEYGVQTRGVGGQKGAGCNMDKILLITRLVEGHASRRWCETRCHETVDSCLNEMWGVGWEGTRHQHHKFVGGRVLSPTKLSQAPTGGWGHSWEFICRDRDRVLEHILDAFDEDWPSWLVLVGGGCHTVSGRAAQFSIHHEAGVTIVNMTTNDSDAENPSEWHLQESPTTVAVEGLSDESEEPMVEDVPTGGLGRVWQTSALDGVPWAFRSALRFAM